MNGSDKGEVTTEIIRPITNETIWTTITIAKALK